jgi:hypothetical protein
MISLMHRLAPLLVLCACGPSLATLESARFSRYDAPFTTVWNATVDEVHKRYSNIIVEDAVDGVIATAWVVIDSDDRPGNRTSANTSGTTGRNTGSLANAGSSGGTNLSSVPGLPLGVSEAYLYRTMVHIKGPPWSVIVDGEGASYQAGLKMAAYHRGAADEPPWVQTRIDNLTAGIYDRLKQYAVKSAAPKKNAEKPLDTTAWKNLSDPAVVGLIGGVRKAAAANDTQALRGYMATDFRWAEGADGSVDTALAMWSADPSALKTLIATLDAGCAADGATGDVVCPGAGAPARFHQGPNGWKFVEFTSAR